MKTNKNAKKYLGLILSLIFINAGCTQLHPTQKNDDTKSLTINYTPDFEVSDFVLLHTQSKPAHVLFYKTSENWPVGSVLNHIQIAVISKKYSKKNSEKQNHENFHAQYLDTTVRESNAQYVVFTLPQVNFDCFAIYLNGKLTKYDRQSLSRLGILPNPSDFWMCKGFDFKTFKPNQEN